MVNYHIVYFAKQTIAAISSVRSVNTSFPNIVQLFQGCHSK